MNITEAEKIAMDQDGKVLRREDKIWIPEEISQTFLLHFYAAEIHGSMSSELEDLRRNYTFDNVAGILKDI
eukprot:snap_masked-scaffold_41-processed-gene-2.40-mRNA-1 protein AED:1.00 eAED:1.00 QI:0/-1/0/0/-1/1/1/0/70